MGIEGLDRGISRQVYALAWESRWDTIFGVIRDGVRRVETE